MIYTPDVKISKNPRIFYSFFWGGKEKRVQNLRKKSLCGDYSSMEKHFEDIPLKMRYFVILQWINFVKSTYFFILTTHKMHLILNENINNIETQHFMKICIIYLKSRMRGYKTPISVKGTVKVVKKWTFCDKMISYLLVSMTSPVYVHIP